MSDQIHLELGALPWAPAETVEQLEVLVYYDMPLSGLLTQGGSTFYYECVEGHLAAANLWAYWRITADEADLLLQAASRGLEEPVLAMSSGDRDITVALAMESRGIVLSAAITAQRLRSQELLAAAVMEITTLIDEERSAVQAVSGAAA